MPTAFTNDFLDAATRSPPGLGSGPFAAATNPYMSFTQPLSRFGAAGSLAGAGLDALALAVVPGYRGLIASNNGPTLRMEQARRWDAIRHIQEQDRQANASRFREALGQHTWIPAGMREFMANNADTAMYLGGGQLLPGGALSQSGAAVLYGAQATYSNRGLISKQAAAAGTRAFNDYFGFSTGQNTFGPEFLRRNQGLQKDDLSQLTWMAMQRQSDRELRETRAEVALDQAELKRLSAAGTDVTKLSTADRSLAEVLSKKYGTATSQEEMLQAARLRRAAPEHLAKAYAVFAAGGVEDPMGALNQLMDRVGPGGSSKTNAQQVEAAAVRLREISEATGETLDSIQRLTDRVLQSGTGSSFAQAQARVRSTLTAAYGSGTKMQFSETDQALAANFIAEGDRRTAGSKNALAMRVLATGTAEDRAVFDRISGIIRGQGALAGSTELDRLTLDPRGLSATTAAALKASALGDTGALADLARSRREQLELKVQELNVLTRKGDLSAGDRARIDALKAETGATQLDGQWVPPREAPELQQAAFNELMANNPNLATLLQAAPLQQLAGRLTSDTGQQQQALVAALGLASVRDPRTGQLMSREQLQSLLTQKFGAAAKDLTVEDVDALRAQAAGIGVAMGSESYLIDASQALMASLADRPESQAAAMKGQMAIAQTSAGSMLQALQQFVVKPGADKATVERALTNMGIHSVASDAEFDALSKMAQTMSASDWTKEKGDRLSKAFATAAATTQMLQSNLTMTDDDRKKLTDEKTKALKELTEVGKLTPDQAETVASVVQKDLTPPGVGERIQMTTAMQTAMSNVVMKVQVVNVDPKYMLAVNPPTGSK